MLKDDDLGCLDVPTTGETLVTAAFEVNGTRIKLRHLAMSITAALSALFPVTSHPLGRAT